MRLWISASGKITITKKVRVVSLARDTPTGPPTKYYQNTVDSRYLEVQGTL